ncbi:VCBS repeat-containing protein [uncultured Roseobacter sp.]|uniref:FG-GAP repeat domain-containing protein n=1 Tax=uncultured Roseobacter sp. TaxID=114847 RepID=UPI00262EC61F|nr:VCBS repeat-containing protein [uncultured Roseobacter sp.]
MSGGARRHLSRLSRALARRALLAVCLWHAGTAGAGERITAAGYAGPTSEYPHGVLGDAVEWKTLRVTAGNRVFEITAGDGRVFEDVAPRLWDITGDGEPEVVAVESDARLGARLVIYTLDQDGLRELAATPNIGTRFRWLAPVGAADLDGDGHTEIAWVDRPHLAKTLRIWRWKTGSFEQIARYPGVSNHRIGEDFISGGLRDCGAGPEMVLADAPWRGILALRLEDGVVSATPVAPFEGPESFEAALSCTPA